MTSKPANKTLAELHAQLDLSNMLSLAESLGTHLTDARAIGEAFSSQLDRSLRGDSQHVVMCGMGGSAIGADMVRSWAGKNAAVPLHVWRGYEMPAYLLNGAFGLVSRH
jgi:glucose/mannose-6-phosphate isomerase